MSALADLPPELAAHPGYRVERELGRGGMGVVYLARNLAMDRAEVLKVLSPSLLGRPGTRSRFLQEIRSAARLHHPNVVTAYAVLELGGLLVLAMEYVDGEDLDRVVRTRGPVPIWGACECARQVALALQHAHEKGLVHRDVKPANLILTRNGKKPVVKILDFGLAKATSDESGWTALTEQGRLLGTPAFMAPEQTFDTASADIRADIYALGCTLVFLLTGRPPFDGADILEVVNAHRHRPPPRVAALRPEVPVELDDVIGRMLAKDPADRFQTPAEAAAALVPFVKPMPAGPIVPDALPPPAPPPDTDGVSLPTVVPPTGRGRRRWPAVGVGLVLAGVAGVTVWVAANPGPPAAVREEAASPGQVTPPPDPPTPSAPPPVRVVVSRFAAGDDEGWTTINRDWSDGATGPVRVAGSEADGFHLVATDKLRGPAWGWRAPAKFYGNHADKYGRRLKCALWVSAHDNRAVELKEPAVILVGQDFALYLTGETLPPLKPRDWVSYSIPLDTSAGWQKQIPTEYPLASEAEIRKVLANVRELWIRSEYSGTVDDGKLDDVEFGADP